MRIIPPEGTPEPNGAADGRAADLAETAEPAKLGTAWLWVAPLLVALFNIWSTVSPNDFWPHVTAGRWVAEHGRIPTTNIFSWGAPLDAPYAYPSWGAGWLLYQTLHIGGLTGIVVLRALCVAATWRILGAVAYRRVRRVAPVLDEVTAGRIVCLVSLMAFGLAATNLDARPQTLVLPLFALLVWGIFEIDWIARQRGARRVALLVAMVAGSAVWTNFHGSFVLGMALPGLALIAEVAGVRSGRGQRSNATALLMWLVAAGAGMLINPRGLHVLDYVTQLNANRTVQRLIYEWQAPNIGEPPGTLFYGCAVVLLVLGALVSFAKDEGGTMSRPESHGRVGLRLGEVLVVAAVFYLATRSIRSILWFALLLVPCASVLAALYWSGRPVTGKATARTAPCRLAHVLVGLLAVGLVVALPPVRARWLPRAAATGFAPSPWGEVPYVLDASTPVAAANYLRVNRRTGPRKLWNSMEQGAYLIWALPPGMAQCDSRIELFSDEFWRDYLMVSAGGKNTGKLLAHAGITDVLCGVEAQSGLEKYLSKQPGWRMKSLGNCKVFYR